MPDLYEPEIEKAYPVEVGAMVAGSIEHVVYSHLVDVVDCTANWRAKSYTGLPGWEDLQIWTEEIVRDVTVHLAGIDLDIVKAAIAQGVGDAAAELIGDVVKRAKAGATSDVQA